MSAASFAASPADFLADDAGSRAPAAKPSFFDRIATTAMTASYAVREGVNRTLHTAAEKVRGTFDNALTRAAVDHYAERTAQMAAKRTQLTAGSREDDVASAGQKVLGGAATYGSTVRGMGYTAAALGAIPFALPAAALIARTAASISDIAFKATTESAKGLSPEQREARFAAGISERRGLRGWLHGAVAKVEQKLASFEERMAQRHLPEEQRSSWRTVASKLAAKQREELQMCADERGIRLDALSAYGLKSFFTFGGTAVTGLLMTHPDLLGGPSLKPAHEAAEHVASTRRALDAVLPQTLTPAPATTEIPQVSEAMNAYASTLERQAAQPFQIELPMPAAFDQPEYSLLRAYAPEHVSFSPMQSFAPLPTDTAGTESIGQIAGDAAGTETIGPLYVPTDTAGAETIGLHHVSTDTAGTESIGALRGSTDTAGTETLGTLRTHAATDTAGTETIGAISRAKTGDTAGSETLGRMRTADPVVHPVTPPETPRASSLIAEGKIQKWTGPRDWHENQGSVTQVARRLATEEHVLHTRRSFYEALERGTRNGVRTNLLGANDVQPGDAVRLVRADDGMLRYEVTTRAHGISLPKHTPVAQILDTPKGVAEPCIEEPVAAPAAVQEPLPAVAPAPAAQVEVVTHDDGSQDVIMSQHQHQEQHTVIENGKIRTETRINGGPAVVTEETFVSGKEYIIGGIPQTSVAELTIDEDGIRAVSDGHDLPVEVSAIQEVPADPIAGEAVVQGSTEPVEVAVQEAAQPADAADFAVALAEKGIDQDDLAVAQTVLADAEFTERIIALEAELESGGLGTELPLSHETRDEILRALEGEGADVAPAESQAYVEGVASVIQEAPKEVFASEDAFREHLEDVLPPDDYEPEVEAEAAPAELVTEAPTPVEPEPVTEAPLPVVPADAFARAGFSAAELSNAGLVLGTDDRLVTGVLDYESALDAAGKGTTYAFDTRTLFDATSALGPDWRAMAEKMDPATMQRFLEGVTSVLRAAPKEALASPDLLRAFLLKTLP